MKKSILPLKISLAILIVFACQFSGFISVNAAPDPQLQVLFQKTQQTIAANKLDEALKITSAAVERARSLSAVEPVDFAYALNNQAHVLSLLKKNPELSERLWLEALSVLAKKKMLNHHAGLIATINLAKHEAAHGKLDAAEARMDTMAGSIQGIALEGNALHSAALFYYENGRIIKASQQFIDVIKRFPDVIKPTFGTLYTTLSKASDLSYKKDNLDDAFAINRTRIQILRTYMPNSAPAIRNVLFDSHFKAYQSGDFAKAAGYLKDWSQTGTPSKAEELSVAGIFDNLVKVAQLVGITQPNAEITLGHAELALAYAKASGEGNASRLGLAWRAMGHAQESADQLQTARDSQLQALSAFEKSKSPQEHVHLILADLGRIAFLNGDLTLAEQYYSRADNAYQVALQAGIEPLSKTDMAIGLLNRAWIDLQTKRPQRALSKLDKAKSLHLKKRETSDFKWNDEIIVANILIAQAHGNMEVGNQETAIHDLKNAARIAQTYFPQTHPGKARMFANIADSLLVLDEETTGKNLLQAAVRMNAVALNQNA